MELCSLHLLLAVVVVGEHLLLFDAHRNNLLVAYLASHFAANRALLIHHLLKLLMRYRLVPLKVRVLGLCWEQDFIVVRAVSFVLELTRAIGLAFLQTKAHFFVIRFQPVAPFVDGRKQ